MLKEKIKFCPFCGEKEVKESIKTKTGILCNCEKCKNIFTVDKPEFKKGK
jgi:ribosomal protein L37AE/L43A